MSILYVKIRLLVFLFCMSFSSFISAEKTSDLLSLYNEALRHDALLSAATIQNQATQELIDQGLSLLLPNISASGSYSDLDNSRKFNTPISNVLLAGTKADYQNYETGNSKSLTQQFVGEILDVDKARNHMTVEVKNRFVVGDELELMTPQGNISFILDHIESAKTGASMESAPGSGYVVKVPLPIEIVPDQAILIRNLPV